MMDKFLSLVLSVLLTFAMVSNPAAVPKSADDLITVQQLDEMLRQEFGDSHGVDPLSLYHDPETKVCRGALYEYVFEAAGVEVFSLELYPGGSPLSSWDNYLRVGKELGLCTIDAGTREFVTCGEAEQLLARFHEDVPEVPAPSLLKQLTIQNNDQVRLNPYLLQLNKIPAPILEEFQQREWCIVLDASHLKKLSDRLSLPCIGATNYQKKLVYLSKPHAVPHEMGHFLHGVLGFPEEIQQLYEREADAASRILGSYAATNDKEYFAECFAYWVRYHEKDVRMAKLAEAAPETCQYLTALAADSWIDG